MAGRSPPATGTKAPRKRKADAGPNEKGNKKPRANARGRSKAMSPGAASNASTPRPAMSRSVSPQEMLMPSGQAGASVAPTAGPGQEMEEEDSEDEDLKEDEAVDAEQEKSDRREALAYLMNTQFTEDQYERYEFYKKTGLSSGSIRKIVNHVTNQSQGTNKVITAFRGIAKTYVGQIVEQARRVQAQQGQRGPLLPEHVREAHRLWQKQRESPGSQRKKLFSK